VENDLGVLFVHGMAKQWQNSTLARFGGSLQRWLRGGSTRSAGWKSKRRSVSTDHRTTRRFTMNICLMSQGPLRIDVKFLESDHAPAVAQFTLLDK
jgi:hypothetical protein